MFMNYLPVDWYFIHPICVYINDTLFRECWKDLTRLQILSSMNLMNVFTRPRFVWCPCNLDGIFYVLFLFHRLLVSILCSGQYKKYSFHFCFIFIFNYSPYRPLFCEIIITPIDLRAHHSCLLISIFWLILGWFSV